MKYNDTDAKRARRVARVPGAGRRWASLVVLVAVLAGSGWFDGGAGALTPAVLRGPELEGESISLTGLTGGQLSYFDAQRRLVSRPAAEFVELVLLPASDTASGGGGDGWVRVELVDGQRIVGRWVDSGEPERLGLDHPRLGRLAVNLDRVRSLRRVGAADDSGEPPADAGMRNLAEGGAGEVDRVLMRNGDGLSGFVVEAGVESVVLVPDGGSESVRLPTAEVAWLWLANPSATTAEALRGRAETSADAGRPGADLVELRDGSRLRVRGLELVGDRARLSPVLSVAADATSPAETERESQGAGGGGVTMELSEVVRVECGGAGRRLVALSDLPWEVTAGGEAFGLSLRPWIDEAADAGGALPGEASGVPSGDVAGAMGPAINGEQTGPTPSAGTARKMQGETTVGERGVTRGGMRGGVWRLHAPVTVAFALPAGSCRVTAEAALDLPADLPAGRGAWADVVVWLGEPVESAEPVQSADAADIMADVGRVRLMLSQPTGRFNVPLAPGRSRLTLRLDPASNGPILDRVALRGARVLVESWPTGEPRQR